MSLDTSQYLRKLYERTLSRTRWQIIGLVSVTFLLVGKNTYAVSILLLAAAAYSGLTYVQWVKSRDILGSKWLEITVNFGLIATLILLTGGLASPYTGLLLIVIIVGSYWYGYPGLVYSVGLSLVFWAAMLFTQPVYELSHLIFGLFAVILGDYAVKLGALTRQEQERIEHDSNAIAQQRKRLFSLVNGLSQAIFVVDKDGKVVVYNGAALELLDTHFEIERLALAEVVHLYDTKGQEVFPVQHALTSGELYTNSELSLAVGDKTKIEVYTSITPMVEDGERVGALLLLRDISEQKTLDNQKDEFISIISHELRTPVAIVEADLSTLMLPKFAQLPEHASKLLTNAYQNLTFLANLLKDLSNLASSERSLLETELAKLDADKLCKNLVDSLKGRAAEQDIKINYKGSAEVDKVLTSPQRVEEILVNFLTNAIKYTKKGGAAVELRVSPSKTHKGGIVFSVADHGIGLKKGDQAQLFTKFFRSENPQAQAVKGTGMGLYICKKQADKIGATITFESKLGEGSVFSLEVPKEIKAS